MAKKAASKKGFNPNNRFVKKAKADKAAGKAAGGSSAKAGRGRKPAATKGQTQTTLKLGKIRIPEGRLSEQATSRVLAIIAKKHETDEQIVELKKQRDGVRQDFNGDETEIENTVDAVKASGRKTPDPEQGRKLVGLLEDRARRKKQYRELGEEIGECRATLKGLFDEMAGVVAKEDPTGTLYGAFGIEKEAEAEEGSDNPLDELGALTDDERRERNLEDDE